MAKKIPTLLTDNRCIIFLSTIPEKYRWLMTAAVLLLGLLVWSLCFYVPLLFKMRSDRRYVQAHKIDTVFHFEGTEPVEPFDVSRVMSLAKEADVRCYKVVPLKRVSKRYDEGYEMHMDGAFQNVLLFLQKLSDIRTVMRIKEIDCKRTGNAKVAFALDVETLKAADT